MCKYILLFFSLCKAFSMDAQEPLLKPGDGFPDFVIRPVINGTAKQFDVKKDNKKFLILNFWGTWCAPCIPEMDNLARLQEKNKQHIQVIAISNEATERLEDYLKKRPSKLWLASDTGFYLYHAFAFNYVGHSAVVDPSNKIIAAVRTDSINQRFIDKLIAHLPVSSSAETGNKREVSEADLFSVDSSMKFHISLGSARPKMTGMGKTYPKTIFEGRRRSYINVPESILYQDAFDIHAPGQVVYLPDAKSVHSSLWCFDILVGPEQKDSLGLIMQEALNKLLPIKARTEKRTIPVYVLSRKTGDTTAWKPAASIETDYWYTGKGFNGTAVPMKIFTDYLGNELNLPIVDETGLTGKYDIKTVNVLRSNEEILKAIDKLGLKVEKATREMDVLVIYRGG